MKIAVTGASGLVGYGVTRHLVALDHEVVCFGRGAVLGLPHEPWALGERPRLAGFDHLVHMAFSHVPGRYRGGEGDDPDGFLALNLDGTRTLWDAAREAGVHSVFLSSRAVYGGYPPGTRLLEEMEPRPDTLYGKVKLEAEEALGAGGVSLRATGVYGPPTPGRGHKWEDLFAAFEAGEALASRVSTEVHVEDLARAVVLAMKLGLRGRVLNVSGFMLDRQELLEAYAAVTGRSGVLPMRADASGVSAMGTDALEALGWVPSGSERLREVVPLLV